MIIDGRWAICVESILTPEFCNEIISHLDTGEGLERVERAALATYSRNILINQDMADKLYDNIKHLLPSDPQTIGCNEYFRFSKYAPGEEFHRHRDGINQDKHGHRAKYTVNIFLNSDFCGGSTEFFDEAGNSVFDARPSAGRGMIFDNQILHCGNKVTEGFKYLLRTDVMVRDGL